MAIRGQRIAGASGSVGTLGNGADYVNLDDSGGGIETVVVPEPAMLALVASGLARPAGLCVAETKVATLPAGTPSFFEGVPPGRMSGRCATAGKVRQCGGHGWASQPCAPACRLDRAIR